MRSPSTRLAAAEKSVATRPPGTGLGVGALQQVLGLRVGARQDARRRPAVGVHHRGGAPGRGQAQGPRALDRIEPEDQVGLPGGDLGGQGHRAVVHHDVAEDAAAALGHALAVEDLHLGPLAGGGLDEDASHHPDPHAADPRQVHPVRAVGARDLRLGGRRQRRPARPAPGAAERRIVTFSKLGQALIAAQ